jgi:hypothetical protein
LIHIAVAHVSAGGRGLAELSGVSTASRSAIEVTAKASGLDPNTDSLVLRTPLWIAPSADTLALVAELCGSRVLLPDATHATVELRPARTTSPPPRAE